jgi:hypothetical protein
MPKFKYEKGKKIPYNVSYYVWDLKRVVHLVVMAADANKADSIGRKKLKVTYRRPMKARFIAARMA